ncbi:MAG: ComEC/Rec2 family competence protein [Oscillospiraceae bacterium]|nr:ComEC/Rec2 family competence protein [Oscillospiraceae bacterium]
MIYFLTALGFSMLASSFAASFLRVDFIILFALLFVLTGIGLRIISKRHTELCAVFLAAALGFGLVGANLTTEYYPAKGLEGLSAEITGTVTEVSAAGGNPVYTVETDYIGIEGAPQNITVKVSGWDDNSADPYDKIACSVTFYVYGGDDISEILTDRSAGISIRAYTQTPIEVTGKDDSSFGYYVHFIREKISSVIYSYFISWHAPFMEELIIGNRGGLDGSITTAFRRSGMSHILAISGMHLVIIIGLFEKLLFYRKSSGTIRKLETVVLVLAVAAYMFIGGLGMSVLRSGFMLIIHYLVRLLLSGSKSLDSLGLAVAAVLFIDPLAGCDVGFLMSVFSGGAIALFSPPFRKFISEKLHAGGKPAAEFFIESFTASTVAYLAVLPVSALTFGEISLAAVPANLFAAFFAQYVLVFGMLTVIFGLIPFLGFFAGGTAFLAMLCSGALLKIAEFFAEIPFAYVSADELWVFVWLIGTAVLVLVPAIYKKSFRPIPCSLALSAILLCAGILANHIFYSGVAKIEVAALEHGIAVSCSKDGNSVLVTEGLDIGDRYSLELARGYDTVISIGAESGAAELDAARSANPQKAIFSFADAAARYEGGTTFSFGKAELFDGAYMDIISEGVFGIDFGETSLLYISEECDIMDIAPEFRRADVIILDGFTPEDFPALRCEYLILRDRSGYFSGATEVITLESGEISFFAYKENIKKGWYAR